MASGRKKLSYRGAQSCYNLILEIYPNPSSAGHCFEDDRPSHTWLSQVIDQGNARAKKANPNPTTIVCVAWYMVFLLHSAMCPVFVVSQVQDQGIAESEDANTIPPTICVAQRVTLLLQL